jgi:hypothetical protein
VVPGYMTFFSLVFVFRLVGGLSICLSLKDGKGPSFGMSHVGTVINILEELAESIIRV